MAPFTVAPVLSTDLNAVNDITTHAFFKNRRTLSWHIFPHQSAEDISAWRLSRTVHGYNTSSESRYYKLVDEATGKPVAFAIWQVPRIKGSEAKENERKAEKDRVEDEFKKNEAFPKGGKKKLLDDFDAAAELMRAKYVDTEKDFILKLIAVLPEYQGQGCGRILIKSGLDIVDAAGARAELEATPQGKVVYERYGFREVDEIVFELEGYGSEGRQVTTCMMRDMQMAKTGGS